MSNTRIVSMVLTSLACSLLSTLASAGISVQVSDSNGNPVADAVVYAETESAMTAGKSSVAEIAQKDKKFIPLVSVVQTGTAVSFPNNDTVRHHAYSFSPAKPFELKLYAGKPEAPIIFDKAGTIVIGCNIHDQMVAYIQVVDTPYFGKTDASGKVRINPLPVGKYTLKTWYYKQLTGSAVHEQLITIKDADTQIAVKLAFKGN